MDESATGRFLVWISTGEYYCYMLSVVRYRNPFQSSISHPTQRMRMRPLNLSIPLRPLRPLHQRLPHNIRAPDKHLKMIITPKIRIVSPPLTSLSTLPNLPITFPLLRPIRKMQSLASYSSGRLHSLTPSFLHLFVDSGESMTLIEDLARATWSMVPVMYDIIAISGIKVGKRRSFTEYRDIMRLK
jgi:hypothetical protein